MPSPFLFCTFHTDRRGRIKVQQSRLKRALWKGLLSLTFPLFSLSPRGRVKNAPTVTSHAEWPIISHCEGHPIPVLPRCQLALPVLLLLSLPQTILCSLFSPHPFPLPPTPRCPPECLARRHAVSQHPALNEKGLLKFIRGWRLRGQSVCLPHSCRSCTGQGRRSRENSPLFEAFYGPILPSLAPGTRGYRILLKRTISLIERSAFGKGIEYITIAFLRVILASLHQATESHAPV